MTRLSPLAGACALAGLIPHAPAAAQTVQDRAPAVTAPATPIAPDAMPDDQRHAVHGQATFVLQATPGFTSPYAGANSLTPRQAKETVDVTLYAGVRPWAGGELWVNPEIDQGFGLSNTLGVAGFPSAEAYKVGRNEPYTRLQRLFLRQTIDLGGAREAVAGVANQLAGSRTADRLVLTIGKFGVGDVFDTNIYAHDPRADFLNWSAVDAGSFDYAADAWGYSTGIAAEWYRAAWTLRLGAFNLSKVPNGETLETGFGQYQLDAEVEHRHQLAGRPGAVRVTVFRNRGRFGRFDEALALAARTGDAADTGLVRSRRTRAGIGINVEQAATDTLGVFARAGIADGQVEPYDFTDIDRTAQAGLSLRGAGWRRGGDTLGAVLIVNAISREHQRYLHAGGLGVLVGDGRLPNAGAEQIGEAYYKVAAARGVDLTVDYQFIADPGYNRDRGPANVFAFRAHGAF
ncbi:carbohydrate porin [Arthrobacter sp. TPD3018]|uniref:carbohydrate porin n=1 Tax=Bacteria TaxID=2 RepID=UPI000D51C1A1|nr:MULTISPECIES: carbohydrate porin [Bacteria]PVE59811.1 carbohydrate porin [Sphingomonas sp. TPD3009]PVE61328.1 carbohydrate porin [Arthrobacter sp. TPD3018]PVE85753.1 carbohydrate porin [Sphingomonas melonis]